MCADLSGGTWLPLPLLLFTTTSCGGEGEQGGRKQSSHAERSRASRWAGSEMTITNRAARWHAMCCWMRMQSTRSTTLVHLPPRRPLHLLLITAFPFPLFLSLPHTTTKKVSASPCSRASTHAMAAMGDAVVGVGRGSNRREEEAQHLTYSHMYHLLLVCACVACRWRRTWAAGDDGDEHEQSGCCCCCCVSSTLAHALGEDWDVCV